MVHSSMYELKMVLQQQVHELDNRRQYHANEARLLEFARDNKQKQLDALSEQIANVEKYEKEQRELALEK